LQELGNDVAALSSGSGVASGTSNPGSPSSGDLFFRTDLGFLIYYDGTRWLSMHEMVVAANNSGVGLSATGEPAGSRGAVRSDYGIYLTRWAVTTFVSTTNTGSAYWVPEVEYRNSANAATSIATTSTGTTPDAANTWIQHDVAVNAVLNSAARTIRFLATKTSTPGNLLMPCTLYGRLIIT
jgi:hypothetical protein